MFIKRILQKNKSNARCSECDTLFNSLMDLEHHKEALGHWSDDDEDDDEEEEEEDDNSETDYDYYYGKILLCLSLSTEM